MRFATISSAIVLLSICCAALADEAAKVAEYQKVIEALGSDDEDARGRALGALESAGDELFESSMDPDEEFVWGPLQEATVRELDRLIGMLESPKSEVGETAASLIGLVGRKGDKAIPALTRLVQDDSAEEGSRVIACLALARVLPSNKPIGPILLPIAKRSKIEFEEIDGPDADLAPEKRKKLGMSWSTMQSLAISVAMYSMMFAGTDRTVVEVPYLVEAASPKYPKMVRLLAIGILGTFEFDGRSAITSLRRLLTDEDTAVRGYALLALVQIEDDPELAKIRLKESKLTGEDASDAQEAIDRGAEASKEERQKLALAFSDPNDLEDGLLSRIIELAKGPHGFHRRSSIRTLGRIGRAAKPALPALRDLLDHPDEGTRQFAAEAIRKIESDR